MDFSRTSDPLKKKFNLKSDRVNLVATAAPIEFLLYLSNVQAIQYKLGPERLTRLENSNVLRLRVNFEQVLGSWSRFKEFGEGFRNFWSFKNFERVFRNLRRFSWNRHLLKYQVIFYSLWHIYYINIYIWNPIFQTNSIHATKPADLVLHIKSLLVNFCSIVKNEILKGTVSVISSNPPCKDSTKISLKAFFVR